MSNTERQEDVDVEPITDICEGFGQASQASHGSSSSTKETISPSQAPVVPRNQNRPVMNTAKCNQVLGPATAANKTKNKERVSHPHGVGCIYHWCMVFRPPITILSYNQCLLLLLCFQINLKTPPSSPSKASKIRNLQAVTPTKNKQASKAPSSPPKTPRKRSEREEPCDHSAQGACLFKSFGKGYFTENFLECNDEKRKHFPTNCDLCHRLFVIEYSEEAKEELKQNPGLDRPSKEHLVKGNGEKMGAKLCHNAQNTIN